MGELSQIPVIGVEAYDITEEDGSVLLSLTNGLGTARLYRPETGVAELRNFDVPTGLWLEDCAERLFDLAVAIADGQGNKFFTVQGVRDERLVGLFSLFETGGQSLSISGRLEEGAPFRVFDSVEEAAAELADANGRTDLHDDQQAQPEGLTIKATLSQFASTID